MVILVALTLIADALMTIPGIFTSFETCSLYREENKVQSAGRQNVVVKYKFKCERPSSQLWLPNRLKQGSRDKFQTDCLIQ